MFERSSGYVAGFNPVQRYVALLIFLYLTYFVVSTVRSYRRLRHIKGPPLAAWSNIPLWRELTSTTTHLWLSEVSSKYGPIARIGPNTLLCCDDELFRKMNTFRYTGKYTKSTWYKSFKLDAAMDNLLSTIDEEKHEYLRSKVTIGYSGKDNPNLELQMDEVIWTFFDLIRRKYLSHGAVFKPMDFGSKAQFFTLDVITGLFLGESIGFLADDEDKDSYCKIIEQNFAVMNATANIPPLRQILTYPFIQRLVLPTVKDKTGMGALKGRVRNIIAARFAGDKTTTSDDMLASFIKHGLTEAEIADESMLAVLAGSDTVATLLRSALISITSNAGVYQRLTRECRDAGVPMDMIVSNAQALKQPYLQACIKEALRQHPVATGLLPRVVGPQGDTHDGIYLPPGTEIGLCAWNAHRLKTTVYGADAALFRPERWLEASPEQLVPMNKSHELVFGYGRFRCMGETIAKIEMNKMFFEMFRRFEWSLIDPLKPLDKNENYGLFIQRGLWLRVTERRD